MTGLGHNGGPSLDDPPAKSYPGPGQTCSRCKHWKPPAASEVRAYESFQRGVGRRVAEPAGYCFNVLLSLHWRATSASGTRARSTCYNWEEKVNPFAPTPTGQGWTTIWQGEKMVWQGREGTEPPEFREEQLGLAL